jgi:hypothetical protein
VAQMGHEEHSKEDCTWSRADGLRMYSKSGKSLSTMVPNSQ